MIEVTGGCGCGAIRYRARVEPSGYWCHCRMCQRAAGNVALAFVNALAADVEWATPPAQWASSPIASRGFCGACGTPLSFAYRDSEKIDLTVGSLDDPGAIRLTSHFGTESRVPGWIHHDGLLEQRADNYAPLQARWASVRDAE